MPFRALVHINVWADRLLILVFSVNVSKPVIQTALHSVTRAEGYVPHSALGWRLLLRKNTGRQPHTLVCRVIRRLPGNAAADFTASVILMILLSHWFIKVTIHPISRNFITDAKTERVPWFQMMWCVITDFVQPRLSTIGLWHVWMHGIYVPCATRGRPF
jgi:hypothetical protein